MQVLVLAVLLCVKGGNVEPFLFVPYTGDVSLRYFLLLFFKSPVGSDMYVILPFFPAFFSLLLFMGLQVRPKRSIAHISCDSDGILKRSTVYHFVVYYTLQK